MRRMMSFMLNHHASSSGQEVVLPALEFTWRPGEGWYQLQPAQQQPEPVLTAAPAAR
jgi:hypothetical protein